MTCSTSQSSAVLKPVQTGNKSCRKRQQKSLFPATFVAENGDFVARKLSPFSATTLAGAAEYLAVT